MAEILSEIGSTLRPAAKQVIKGGLLVTNAVSGFASEAGGGFRDLLKEARTEVNDMHAARISKTKAESEGLYHRLAKAAHYVWDTASNTASKMASSANVAAAAIVAWSLGESKQKAEAQVEKSEEFVEHLAKELTKEESANVIETVLLAAVA